MLVFENPLVRFHPLRTFFTPKRNQMLWCLAENCNNWAIINYEALFYTHTYLIFRTASRGTDYYLHFAVRKTEAVKWDKDRMRLQGSLSPALCHWVATCSQVEYNHEVREVLIRPPWPMLPPQRFAETREAQTGERMHSVKESAEMVKNTFS